MYLTNFHFYNNKNYLYSKPLKGLQGCGVGYRFSFNGKENDDETQTQDYGFRIYNTRLGKFLSVDPLTKQYPELTPYQFAGNTPIQATDLDGLEPNYINKNNNINIPASDNLQHTFPSYAFPQLKSTNSSYLELKLTAVVTIAEHGASFKVKLAGVGLELTDVTKERDLIGFRDNKFVKNDKKETDKFGAAIGPLGIDISKEKNKNAVFKTNMGPIELGKEGGAAKLGGDLLNVKVTIPIIDLGIEMGAKVETK